MKKSKKMKMKMKMEIVVVVSCCNSNTSSKEVCTIDIVAELVTMNNGCTTTR